MVIIDPLQEVATGTESETDIEHLADSQTRCRPVRTYLDMLDALIHILTPLQNIRQRDLKSRHPLSQETLKMLRKPDLGCREENTGKTTRISISRGSGVRGKESEQRRRGGEKVSSRYSRPRHSVVAIPPPERTDTWEYFLTLGTSTERSCDSAEQSSRHGSASRNSMLSQLVKNLPIAKRMMVVSSTGQTTRIDK